jgi:hypothetical protein
MLLAGWLFVIGIKYLRFKRSQTIPTLGVVDCLFAYLNAAGLSNS